MARREFEVRDIVEIYMHWQARRGIRRIARNLAIDRNTVKKYIRPAVEAGFQPGEARTEAEWAEFIRRTFPEVADPMRRHKIFEEIGRHHNEIREGLAENKASAVWQRLRDEAGLQASLSSFRRYIRAMMPEAVLTQDITVWRPEVLPGEEGQVDFGYLGKWTDPVTVMVRRVWAFVLVLAFSRHMFVKPVFRMDAKTWVECHILAFEFFGEVPRRIAPDNLKGGVLKPSIYDPAFNRDYAQMASHYVHLCTPVVRATPRTSPASRDRSRTSGKVTGAVRNSESPSHMDSEAVRWCLSVAGLRIHGTTRQRPLEHFESVEKLSLNATAQGEMGVRLVADGQDRHGLPRIGGRKSLLGAVYVGRTLDVRMTDKTIQFFLGEELVKTHSRTTSRRKTDLEDLPPEKIAFYARNPEWCTSARRNCLLSRRNTCTNSSASATGSAP